MNTIDCRVYNEADNITLIITDIDKEPPRYTEDVILMIGKEMILRGDKRTRMKYPFMMADKKYTSVTCDFIIGKGKLTIKFPFSISPGDNNDEFNKLIDKFIVKPYIKLMAKHFGLI